MIHSERNWKWTDAHFCSLPSQQAFPSTPQTNIYGHTKVVEKTHNTIFVASLAGKLTAVEYERSSNKLQPSTSEIQFIYIPPNAELVSIDVARKYKNNEELMVGITFTQHVQTDEGENSMVQYLNLYSANQKEDFLENFAKDCTCVNLELTFVPYQLIHTKLLAKEGLETVFLLSGSDCRVHLYREKPQDQKFVEEVVEEFFPEFTETGSCITWMEVMYFDDDEKRLTAYGEKDGQVTVTLVNVLTQEIENRWVVSHRSCVTCVKIFSPSNDVQCPSFISPSISKNAPTVTKEKIYNVLVVNALEPAIVYQNVLANGLKEALCLAESSCYDIPLCACVVDIDFDGENEIIIGTYGQEILAYKLTPELPRFATPGSSPCKKLISTHSATHLSDTVPHEMHGKLRHLSNETASSRDTSNTYIRQPPKSKSQENLSSSIKHVDTPSTVKENITMEEFLDPTLVAEKRLCYNVLWHRSFASPVMGVDNVDIMGDGMDDLVVVTLNGVHVIQPDLNEVAQVCLERLRGLFEDENDPKSDFDVPQETASNDEVIKLRIDKNLDGR